MSKQESISIEVYDQLQIEVEQERYQRRNALLAQNFERNQIRQAFRFNQNTLDSADIPISQIKRGTSLFSIVNMSQSVSKYAIESINDYKQLFLYDKEQKKVPDRLKENDEKEFKKFVLSFI